MDDSSPRYGNYHGYYTKRPFVEDPRLGLLPPDLFSRKRILDVGCNDGLVTCEIAQIWGASQVIGVDIDEALIRAAWRRRRSVWSLQAPSSGLDGVYQMNHESERPPTSRSTSNYFPMSCEHEFGSLPVPPFQIRGKHVFPHNISFRTADWVNSGIPEDADGYDVVVAFSISKWVHLNNGDDGIKLFFQRVYDVLKLGGKFILEPQPWETYSKAKRLHETLRENAKKLQLRPEDFGNLLKDIGFSSVTRYGNVGEGGFRRPVEVYTKQ